MANKLLADSNRASLREIIESNTAWGATPATGVTRARRFKTSSITASKTTAVSEEIRDDRMVSSVIETAAMSGGDIAWEFAAGTSDYDFQRALMGLWSRPMDWDVFRGKVVSITDNNTVTIAGGDYTAYFTVGRRIKTSGFVNPANNDYLQISAVAFAGGNTTIDVTGTTLVAETGSNGTTVQDANDVIVHRSTAIRFGSTANTIDSNGANVFAAAIAAGQIVTGQRIFVEGVGYESGTVTIATAVDNETVTISDGVNSVTFEAQSDTDVADVGDVVFAIGVDDTATAVNLAAAINALRPTGDLNVFATSALGVVTVTNLNKTGGAITSTAASLTEVNFSGGVATFGGFYTIVTATDDALVVDRAVPTVAAGKKVTIKGSMLRNPSNSAAITPQSSTVETGFHDVGQYFVVDGLRTGSVELDVSSGAIVTGSCKLQGRATVRASTEKLTGAGYTPLDAPATEVVSATANVGSLSVDGVEQATAIKSIKLTIDGNLREQQAVGSKFPVGIAAGRLNVTGTIDAYFADGTMYDRFINHETVSLAFPIIDQDKNTYYFTLPAFKVSADPIAPAGIDQDVMESMTFTAFRDVATKCMVQIDRFSSTAPITAL
jgi:hypothetical protein